MKKVCVAAALIKQNGKILLAKRAKGELAGFWEFPGGKIEKGENANQAIVREIKEELGLDVIPLNIIDTWKHKYPFLDLTLTLVGCKICNYEQKIKLDGSHLQVKWVFPNDESIEHTPLDKRIISSIKW